MGNNLINESKDLLKAMIQLPTTEDQLKNLGYSDEQIKEYVKTFFPGLEDFIEKIRDLDTRVNR